jgi:hypothetical protein
VHSLCSTHSHFILFHTYIIAPSFFSSLPESFTTIPQLCHVQISALLFVPVNTPLFVTKNQSNKKCWNLREHREWQLVLNHRVFWHRAECLCVCSLTTKQKWEQKYIRIQNSPIHGFDIAHPLSLPKNRNLGAFLCWAGFWPGFVPNTVLFYTYTGKFFPKLMRNNWFFLLIE